MSVSFDAETGVLTLDGTEIGPRTSRHEFLKSPLVGGAIISVKNEPWCSWQLRTFPLEDGMDLYLTAYFEYSKLKFISMALGHPDFGTNWDDWSTEKEKARHRAHEALLREWGAPAGEYAWGKVWCGFDPKTGDAGFSVHYG
jgi:hypothetical protein